MIVGVTNMKMKILHICASLDSGGVEKSIYHYMKALANKDIDFVVVKHCDSEGMIEKKLVDLGCKVYYVTPKSVSFIRYYKQLSEIFAMENIDVCHCHQGYMATIPLLISFFHGVKVRIAHSHTAFEKEGIARSIYRKANTIMTKKVATNLFSCSDSAGIWMWKNNFHVIYNAFCVKEYEYNRDFRVKWRQKIAKEEDYVVGCVCRMVPSKNLFFLLDIFREIVMLCPNAKLVFVGDGLLKEELMAYSKETHIFNKIEWMGKIEHVNEVLNAFDVFVLPSLFEGLGIGYIEAQVNCLHTFATAEKVPSEAGISEFMHFVELSKSPKQWAQAIVKYNRMVDATLETDAMERYNIEKQVERLYHFYREGLL